ncbi:hypothetical protein SLA2020_262250 [Shorea laevis]
MVHPMQAAPLSGKPSVPIQVMRGGRSDGLGFMGSVWRSARHLCSNQSRKRAKGEALSMELIFARDDRSEGLLRDSLRTCADGVQLCR